MVSRIETDVAIVGAGPAGLSAAVALRARGVERVTVLEREDRPGGAVRHCGHPPFGLREFGRVLTGPQYARRLAARAEAAGVAVRMRHAVVRLGEGGRLDVATPDGLLQVEARRVLLATGAREATRASRLLSGERPIGVINTGALQSHIHLYGRRPFLRPVIVGSELVAMSAVWTCISHGLRPAALVEANDGPAVRWPLGAFPPLCGVEVHYAARIAAVHGRTQVDAVDVEEASGRVLRIPCDGVLLTGGWTPETALMRSGGLDVDPGDGAGVCVDQYGRCSDPAYFAAGNVLRGVETAGWCWREGLGVAQAMADALAGRLPDARASVPIVKGPGLRLTSPQRLAFPLRPGRCAPLQLRASERGRGRLVVRADGRELWSRRVRLAPERRVLAPLAWAARAEGRHELTVGVE